VENSKEKIHCDAGAQRVKGYSRNKSYSVVLNDTLKLPVHQIKVYGQNLWVKDIITKANHVPKGGGTPDFKWQGWANGGKNQNPKKSLGLPTNPKKSLDQNWTPKKPHAKFPSLKNFQKGLTHKSQAKDIMKSLQQKGIPVPINTMDEKSVEWIEALLDTARDTLWTIV